VAQQLLDGADIHPAFQQGGGVGVAQIVEGAVDDLDCLAGINESWPDISGDHWAGVGFIWE